MICFISEPATKREQREREREISGLAFLLFLVNLNLFRSHLSIHRSIDPTSFIFSTLSFLGQIYYVIFTNWTSAVSFSEGFLNMFLALLVFLCDPPMEGSEIWWKEINWALIGWIQNHVYCLTKKNKNKTETIIQRKSLKVIILLDLFIIELMSINEMTLNYCIKPIMKWLAYTFNNHQ